MINLIGQWVGTGFGTHPMNIFAEFTTENGKILASIRAAILNQGVTTFVGICIQKENTISINVNESLNGHFSNVTGNITLTITSENQLEGNFEFNTGAKGIIQISRFLFANSIKNRLEPLQIIAQETTLDYPLKIYKKDIEKIIKIMKELATSAGTLTITVQAKGTKITQFADDYLKAQTHEQSIDNLSFTSQVIVPGFVNTITLNLNRNGSSYIISQSPDFLWSHTAPIMLKEMLEQKTSKSLGLYKKYGLEINSLLFLFLLTILPSFEFRLRLVCIIGFLIFAFSYRFGYRQISQTVIHANNNEPITFKEKYPRISYLLITIFSAALGGAISFGVNTAMKHFFEHEPQTITSNTVTSAVEKTKPLQPHTLADPQHPKQTH